MDSESRDRYETDNLVWQLEKTLEKLSDICKKNGRLVDYIGKRVNTTVNAWQQQKEHFKQLSWAELDDSDLELDLDITLPTSPVTTDTNGTTFKGAKGEQEQVPSPKLAIKPHDTDDDKQPEPNPNTDAVEGVLGAHSEDLKRQKARASLRSVEEKVAATAKVEHEASAQKKESQRIRLERALQRKQNQQKLVGLRQQSQQNKVQSIKRNNAQENEENQTRMQQRHDRAQMNVQRLMREKLIRKYLHIPRVVRKSESSINLYADIERFYRGTLGLLQTTDIDTAQPTLAALITQWLRGTADKQLEDAQYDRDVLLVTNRLICFDIRAVSSATQKEMLAMLAQTTRNRMAAELLSLRYLNKLLALFSSDAHCADYKLLALLVGRCLADTPSSQRRGLTNAANCKGEYERFRKQTHAVILREIDGSSFIRSAANVLQKNEDLSAVRSALSVLARVSVLLSVHSEENEAVCRALLVQTKETRCVEWALRCATVSVGAALRFAAEMLRFSVTMGMALSVDTDVVDAVANEMALSTECKAKLTKPFLRFVAVLTLSSKSNGPSLVTSKVDEALLVRLSEKGSESEELRYAAMVGLTLRCKRGREKMTVQTRDELRRWITRKLKAGDGRKPRRQSSARRVDEEWLKVLMAPKMLKESLRMYRRSGR